MHDYLQLEQFFTTQMDARWHGPLHPQNMPQKQDFDLGVDYDFAPHDKSPSKFRMVFKFGIKPKNSDSGMIVNVAAVGFFSHSRGEAISLDDIEVRQEACRILYDILRGQVSLVTGAFPRGKLPLPSLDMSFWAARIEAAKAPKGPLN